MNPAEGAAEELDSPVVVSRVIERPIDDVFEHFVNPTVEKRLHLHDDHVREYREIDRGPDHLEYEFVFQAYGFRFFGRAREDFDRPRRTRIAVSEGALTGARIELLFEPAPEGTKVTQRTLLPPRALRGLVGYFGGAVRAKVQALTAVHLDDHKRDLEGRGAADRTATAGAPRRTSPLALFARATRVVSLPMIVLPLLVGVALAPDASWWRAFVTFAGGALALFAGNLSNDLWDFTSGADHAARAVPGAVETGSGVFIDALLSPRHGLALAAALALGAAACGAALTPAAPLVPAFALAGLAAALAYQMPPLRLAYRGGGLGELCIWAAFGPIPVAGAAYAQTGVVSSRAVALGAVVGVGSALVLYAHHFLHWESDRTAGKRGPVATLGPQRAAAVGAALAVAYAALLAASPWLFALPKLAALAALPALTLVPPFVRIARVGAARRPQGLLVCAALAFMASTGALVAALVRSDLRPL